MYYVFAGTTKLSGLVAITVLIASCSIGGAEETYDLVIMNGRVTDPETGFDGVRNVGIKNGRIVAITEGAIFGAESIDASGLVVSPGFIYTEQHGLGPWGVKVHLRDGGA